jgi:hypothetical protein
LEERLAEQELDAHEKELQKQKAEQENTSTDEHTRQGADEAADA